MVVPDPPWLKISPIWSNLRSNLLHPELGSVVAPSTDLDFLVVQAMEKSYTDSVMGGWIQI
ncbi:unnamed protein product [Arabidopsis thaliana]|uniref:Uncharacterized protein n=1 Tax=Arabidopsis thaliana TaxID=3702 RepID=A0A654FI48_ARATH|nr:unnamed protein product [Arabidopsis thaliana]